ncbi:hypothetical protein SDC9_169389 [bioreactor metagenome]|uniref:Uncharacterized protein n=1 Tax=bioreactor metagenome TaxID=1076179 RepID=A0A645G781_9ZZZZ
MIVPTKKITKTKVATTNDQILSGLFELFMRLIPVKLIYAYYIIIVFLSNHYFE